MSFWCRFRHDWDVLLCTRETWNDRYPVIGSICYRCNQVYTSKGPMDPNSPIVVLTRFAQAMQAANVPANIVAKSLVVNNRKYGDDAVSPDTLVQIAQLGGASEADLAAVDEELKAEQQQTVESIPEMNDGEVQERDDRLTLDFHQPLGNLTDVSVKCRLLKSDGINESNILAHIMSEFAVAAVQRLTTIANTNVR